MVKYRCKKHGWLVNVLCNGNQLVFFRDEDQLERVLPVAEFESRFARIVTFGELRMGDFFEGDGARPFVKTTQHGPTALDLRDRKWSGFADDDDVTPLTAEFEVRK